MFLQELLVLFDQKVDSCIESCHLLIQSNSKITSKLSNVSVFQIGKRLTLLLCQVDLIDSSFLREEMNLRNVALHFRSIKASESWSYVKSGNRSFH